MQVDEEKGGDDGEDALPIPKSGRGSHPGGQGLSIPVLRRGGKHKRNVEASAMLGRWEAMSSRSPMDCLHSLCFEVAGGRTLSRWCRQRKVAFSDVLEWIHGDPAREAAYKRAQADRREWAAEGILRELARMGFADPRALEDAKRGGARDLKDLPPGLARAVSAVEWDTPEDGGGRPRVRRYKLANRIDALSLLAKVLGLIKPDGPTVEVNLATLVEQSMIQPQPGQQQQGPGPGGIMSPAPDTLALPTPTPPPPPAPDTGTAPPPQEAAGEGP